MKRTHSIQASLLALVLTVFCSTALAAETATVRVKTTDGKVEAKTATLVQTAANVFRLQIPAQDIAGNVEHIEVVYDLATAKKGDEGYFVVSDGRRGFFRADSGRLEERRNPMPLFGMKTSRGTFVGIVKGLKYEFSTVVEVKEGVYTMYPRFLIKAMAIAPYEDVLIDFYRLEGADANYSGMARAYRKYQLGRGEVKPLRERVQGNPQLAYTADSMFIRVKHGVKSNKDKIEHQTPENEPEVKVFHTFDDFMKIMRDLKALGVDKAEMCSVGWHSGGFDGRYPQLFPVEPAFGGEAKLREAIRVAHDLGYQIVCHVCNNDAYMISNRWDENDIAKRADGSLDKGAIWAGGRSYHPCFQRVYEKYVPDDYQRLAALGFKGTHHIDVTSCIVPAPCHDPKHPCTRQQTADYMNKIGALADQYFGGFGSEGPCDHVARTLDYVLYVWAYPSWVGRAHPLMDDLVPIWQIAYHGIILSNPFYSTIDYNFPRGKAPAKGNTPYYSLDNPQTRRLKLVEFGGRPTFYFTNYKNLKPIKEAYDEYQPLKYLQYEFMESHDQLAPQVFVTRYSDKSEIVVNYADKEFPYKGRSVGPMAYELYRPSP